MNIVVSISPLSVREEGAPRMRPLFILSLSRSGSTLLQRILGADPSIATASEPWFLLSYLSTLRRGGILADYRQDALVEAVEDFAAEMPNGLDDYLDEIRSFVLTLYKKASWRKPDAFYFLDKTPPYYLVLDQLFRLFPDGKFVFLWRNPLAVAASYAETFNSGKWNLHWARPEFLSGIQKLVSAYRAEAHRSHAVQYERLVTHAEEECARLFAYLELPFRQTVLEQFSKTTLRGRRGDPTGVHRYRELSTEPLDRWKATLSNPLRKRWAGRFVRRIGDERLAVMGYEAATLLSESEAVPTTLHHLGSDLVRATFGPIKRRLFYQARAWQLAS